ncbi:MAG: NYN domain-containing protein [Rubrivivax sp.]|nr:NYN domain-containing protein [Rubrivivax sp.]
MTQERVMLLIDADNVSLDIIEQAVQLVHKQHGALHVRRAYCTAESAVKHQAAFKRLSIKPMVNLSAGKNSTDIALAVDAIDLVLAERPDVVVIASSDSDFAPLVQRLREKGCAVRGIGQHGKTGDETQDAYDDYTVLEHRKAAASAAPVARKAPARRAAAAKNAAEGAPAAAKKVPAAKKTAAKKAAAKTAGAPAAKAPRKAAAKTAAKAPASASARADEDADDRNGAAAEAPGPVAPPPAAPPAARSPARGATTADAVLASLPELAAGQTLALNTAVQRLREAGLLSRSASSLKLFSQLGERFELLPPGKPSQVRLRH